MITLITGGQRSGKSALAEKLYSNADDGVYIATAEYNPHDAEMLERIKAHQSRRNANWRTVECYKNFSDCIGTERHYLLDCVTNCAARVLFDFTGESDDFGSVMQEKILAALQAEFETFIENIRSSCKELILVTNEVGFAVIPMQSLSRMFVDLQGKLNSFLAAKCDRVYLCVCGIPLQIK